MFILVRVENETLHDVDYNEVYARVKIFKNKHLNKFKQGGARPVRRRWIRLWRSTHFFRLSLIPLIFLTIFRNFHFHYF